MSRALDPETASAISSGDAQEIYNDISKALSSCTESLIEIEFLGNSHPLPPGTNILVDGQYIGVSKAKLVQAFLVARKILFNLIKDCPDDNISELQDATAVILLMDPEHLTVSFLIYHSSNVLEAVKYASIYGSMISGLVRICEADHHQAANTRKRLIQRLHRGSRIDFDLVLKKDLLFVDSYLTSRLHRHTKSPTLWGHRRWLIGLSTSSPPQHEVLEDLQSVVFVAAERHPKNYYAWSHMRWLTRTYTCSNESFSSSRDLSQIITMTKDWCLRHPSDTSGFSFLLFLLSYSQSARYSDTELSNMCSAVCNDVLRLASSFKWTHEAVWVFLRTVVARYGMETNKTAFYVTIDDLSGAGVCSESKTVLGRASDWCSTYQQKFVVEY